MENQSIDLLKTPYKGLIPYSEEDAQFFFGRKKDTKSITDCLTGSPLTLLYGSSGVGKSSVLRAGVAYNLQQEAKQNLEDCGTPEFAVVVFNSWREDSLLDELVNSVQDSVAQVIEKDLDKLKKLFQGQEVQDHLKLTETLPAWADLLSGEDVRGKLFIILDQFEEYFLYHPDEKGEQTFFGEFGRVVNHPDVNFLISIREDALDQLDCFKPNIPSLFDNYLRIRHLDAKSAYEAIVKPIDKYNELLPSEQPITIEPDLAKVVIDEVSQVVRKGNGLGGLEKLRSHFEKQIETPYLQLVMNRLWDEEMKTGSRCLQLKTFFHLDGAEQIVRDHLNEKMESLKEDEKKAAAKVFQYLVTPSGNKIAYPVLDLVELTKLRETQLKNLLNKLSHGRQRILRSVRRSPSKPDVERYEIFHDVLAQPILDWRKQYLLDEEKHRRNLAIKKGLPAESLRLQRRRQDERAALLARQAYLFNQRDHLQILDQIDDALREALSVDNFSNTLECEDAISSVAFRPSDGQTVAYGCYNGTVGLWNCYSTEELGTHQGAVYSVAFSPDGQMLASGSDDHTIKLWNLSQPDTNPKILKHEGKVMVIAFFFSEDKKVQLLASGSGDKKVRLWNLLERDPQPTIFDQHEDIVNSVAFSPNGQILASAGDDKTIRLWNPSQPDTDPKILENHKKPVCSIAFNPDGQILASGSEDKTIQLWDPSQNKPFKILEDHEGRVNSVAFSSNGQMLASGSDDETIRIWNLHQNNTAPRVLKGHYFNITSVAFSPDDQMLASGSWDNTLRFWDLREPIPKSKPLKGSKDTVMAVAFSPDGQMLASGSWDETVRLWNLSQPAADPKVLEKHEGIVMAVTFFFSKDKKVQMLASGSADGKVRLWNLHQLDEAPIILEGHKDGVSSLAFSPDGTKLASGSWGKDRRIGLWDLSQLNEESIYEKSSMLPSGHDWSITSVQFSPNGKILASASNDKTIRLWNLQNRDVVFIIPIVLQDHAGRVWSITFSPDGKMLASGSDDWTVRLWDLSQLKWDPNQPNVTHTIVGRHNSWVGSVAFSQDGKTLASGSYDRSIKLWNLQHLDEPPIVLEGHEQSVTSVAFSPDGKTLASGSYDNTIRLWNTSTKELANMVCQKVLRNLTIDEWQHFMGEDIAYEKTCPDLPPGERISKLGQSEEVSELEQEFRVKLSKLFPGQKGVLEFIERRTAEQPDIDEEDVTNFLNKPIGDAGTFYRLETLRLLGFVQITAKGHAPGTIRYGLSQRYQEYLRKTQAS